MPKQRESAREDRIQLSRIPEKCDVRQSRSHRGSLGLYTRYPSLTGTPRRHGSVLGAGAIELLTVAALSAPGISEVVVADIDSTRLTIATDLGLAIKTFLIPMRPTKTEISGILKDVDGVSAKIAEAVRTDDFDGVYECTGLPSCLHTGIYVSKPGRKVVLIGMGAAVQTLPLSAAVFREVDIIGIFRYSSNLNPIKIKLIAIGKLTRIHELITHERTWQRAEEAFVSEKNRRDAKGQMVLKVVIEV